ncbi:excinuclease ABC subunit UvrA [Alistipes sp. ZOR0009]|uniref:excinuclease ABC subunit UvrA n=1 Tax=Alistipes sp. ZOR0009 TaxID=1339253 RepID=UPI00068A4B1E|nr:excinuclease ABC subunit UvrA [Alistipes sp. ZOR0009]
MPTHNDKTIDDALLHDEGEINVLGARVHNLRNIDVTIPRNALTVITGLSGSGKSSLAFETIYAEGQRRYLETLSAYARQFMGNMERPDVDKITGLSPVIAIEQKTTNKNPRSTVGTITEVYDFMRLLFARASIAYSKNTGEQMVRYTDDQIVDLITENMEGKKAAVLAPLVKGRKGHYKELFEQLSKKGFLYARVDGNILEIKAGMKLDRYKVHHVELVVDKLVVKQDDRKRLRESVVTAMNQGKGTIMVLDYETDATRFYSRHLMCPSTGISYNEPAPHSFSFNSPQGACPHCNGLGHVVELDVDKIIPNPKLSIRKGGIEPIGAFKNALIFWQIEAIGRKYGFTLNDPIEDISEDAMNIILYGSDETFRLSETPMGTTGYVLSFDGIIAYLSKDDDDSEKAKKKVEQFTRYTVCPQCNGTRLKEEALYFKVAEKNISELSAMDIETLLEWFLHVDPLLNSKQKAIARDILKEIRERLSFLIDVGLGYLSLSRSSGTLSGGESQRIRLATQIGSKLVNVLYILDEPSIGLHQRDNMKLITSLKQLRDSGNSVIVVEHDEDMMKEADYIVDMGPRAGVHGGDVVAAGTFETIKNADSLTGKYLRSEKKIAIPEQRRQGNGECLTIKGATGNNLKNVSVSLPLGSFICVTGVSGSGKSTLINGTLHPILSKHFYRSTKEPMPYKDLEGLKHLDKVIDVDQSPLGRTPRSNPATYTNVFGDIRKLFESTPESKIRGFKAGRFSFNVKGGRCEKCKGAGVQTIEMNFLPDVYVTCKTCNGKRYNRETLEVKYKGKTISDVLNMTIDQAAVFFEHIPSIHQKIKALKDVGLGYITLGQPSTTLSGGESQRVKLATELAKRDTGNTLYILDEPTTGLHFDDVRQLLDVLQKLVDRGNTMIVIEHNLDVIKVADYLIDMGPEGGAGGGVVVATGTPEVVAKNKKSYTGQFLKAYLK